MTPHDLLQHLDVIAEAPNGIARLRELVLQLAVRGKLVPQDPEDEPAAVLLQRIKEEKALTPDGRAVVDYEDGTPFEIPSAWEWVHLGQAMGLVNGMAFKPTHWSTKGLPIIRIQNLNDPAAPFNYCAFPVKEKFYVNDKNLLLSWSGTPGTSFGAFIWKGGKAVLNQHIFRCEPRGEAFDLEYLRLAINSRLAEMIERAHGGVGLRHVTKGKLEGLWLPLPPLTEQRRIVARVDELMALLDRLEAARNTREATRRALRDSSLAALRDVDTPDDLESAWQRVAAHMDDLLTTPEDLPPFRQTILQLAVRGRLVPQDTTDEPATAHEEHQPSRRPPSRGRRGQRTAPCSTTSTSSEPFRLPSSWRWVALEHLLVDGPTNGWSPKAVEMETSTRTLKLSATTKGVFDASQHKFVDAQLEPDSLLWLRSGDLLIQRSNTPEYVGMAAVYDGPDETFIYPDLMMRCRLRDDVSVAWVHKALLAPFNRKWFTENASGTSDSMVKLNQATVRATRIPLPPPAEQRRIVARINGLMIGLDRLGATVTSAAATHDALAAAAVHQLDV